jgi:hypothetical protein
VRETFDLAFLQVANGGERAGGERRRQRRREDKAGSERADEVAERRRSGDVAAHDAEGLAERAFDDRQPVHQPLALGDAAAARAVHADRVHFVQIGHCAVFVGEVAEFPDRRDVAIHRIDGFKGDDLWRARIGGRKLGLEVRHRIVLEDDPLAFRVADALDHRSVVAGIRKDDDAGNLGTERPECGPVRNVTGGEQKSRFLAVQVGEFALEQHMIMVGAGDVAGPAGAGAAFVDRVLHRLGDDGTLAHAEIVVRAPNGHFLARHRPCSAWPWGSCRDGGRDRRKPGNGLPDAAHPARF